MKSFAISQMEEGLQDSAMDDELHDEHRNSTRVVKLRLSFTIYGILPPSRISWAPTKMMMKKVREYVWSLK